MFRRPATVKKTEIRRIPFNGMVEIPLGGVQVPKYGDFAPQLRIIKDIAPWRGTIVQGELMMGQGLEVGLRLKKEVDIPFTSWSVVGVGGARVKLKWPALVKAIFQ